VVLLKKLSAIVRGVETSNLPSQTALTAAAARAAHLIVDRDPVIFADELAAILLGEQAEEFISYHRLHGTHLVQLITDYMLPAALRDETGNTYADLVAPTAAERGEPWLTFLAPGDMSALLETHGFSGVEHVRQRDSVPAALWDRTDSLRPATLSVLARATLRPAPGAGYSRGHA